MVIPLMTSPEILDFLYVVAKVQLINGGVVPSRGVAFLPPSDISTKTLGRGNKNVQGRENGSEQWSLAFPYCFFRFRRTNDGRLTADRESQRNDRIPS